MRFLSWDETLFQDPEVFDPDYIPENIKFRDRQIDRIVANLKPAIMGARPVNMVCLGTPGTGKTTVIKMILRELESNENVVPAYVNCQLVGSLQGVYSRIFERVYGYPPASYGIPFQKIYASVMKKILELNKVLVVALDDINLIFENKLMNEIIYSLLKAHEDVEGVKTGIIAIATDLKLSARFDERVGSIFHPDEIYFDPYGFEEILEILRQRCEIGFYPGVVDDEVLNFVAEQTAESGDIRVGLYILKMAGIEAERNAKRKIDFKDVESVLKDSRRVLVRKCITALNDIEKELLKIIYLSEELTSGELYEKFRERRKMSYTKFYSIVSKLENLRLIDTLFKTLEKGRTRVIIKRFDPEMVLSSLEEFS
jgi:cell division control protein 6